MFKRPTTLAAAFINAAVKRKEDIEKVDHNRWVARRVAANCDREGFGMVTERDTRPQFKGK